MNNNESDIPIHDNDAFLCKQEIIDNPIVSVDNSSTKIITSDARNFIGDSGKIE